jgi:hypothetical protein
MLKQLLVASLANDTVLESAGFMLQVCHEKAQARLAHSISTPKGWNAESNADFKIKYTREYSY